MGTEIKNLFCARVDLKNESTVEQLFVIRLLNYLNYDDSSIKMKTSLNKVSVGRGSRKENYKPDYVCLVDEKPKIVIDAKSPNENIDEYIYQVSGYALSLNQQTKKENPIIYTILTNGLVLKLFNWDESEPILTLDFKDFVKSNQKFEKLIRLIDYNSIKEQNQSEGITIEKFLQKPYPEEVKSIFEKCHNIIWKKEKISPTDAFYEFTKIIFVKLNEDKRIREIIKSGRKLTRNDFKFSINWIRGREEERENPISSILFKDLLDRLQEEITQNNKKLIFQKDEQIRLKSSTVEEVVKILQEKDLYTIDEDLNGRMFETFLNATVRGKELGQYFTPRKVVKFMTKMANLQVKRVNGEIVIDSVLDACCGSGGFLIDALAELIEKTKNNRTLSPYEDEVLEKIKKDSIFGIDANEKISRIARINMYVHGDGGSRIYCADALDKEISIQQGTDQNRKKEIEELKKSIVEEKREFDVVLSNPPFSMSYKNKESDDRKILLQYASQDRVKNLTYTKGGKLKPSVKSNVLFIARYSDFLKKGGRMFIVLDNSVLNSSSHKDYREFIRKNFIIKGIFQLPTHTFVNQQAGGITSILYLEKRADERQEQPPIFAKVIEKVGHTTSGREEEEDDFGDTLREYEKYEQEGNLYIKNRIIKNYENDKLFLIEPSKIDDRLDVFFHQPSYHKLLSNLKSNSEHGQYEIKKLKDFQRVKNNISEEDKNGVYRYIEIGTIDKDLGQVIINECEKGTLGNLPERAKIIVKENDLLFSKPYRSLKKIVIIPKILDKQVASSGFYIIRPKNYTEGCILWGIFRSSLIQKQLKHLSSGYTQRELNDEYLEKYLLVPVPIDTNALKERIHKNIESMRKAREKEEEAINKIIEESEKAIFG